MLRPARGPVPVKGSEQFLFEVDTIVTPSGHQAFRFLAQTTPGLKLQTRRIH